MIELDLIQFDNAKQQGIQEIDRISSNHIAVIGMGLRMPQARNKDEFWDVFVNNKDCIIDFPESRKKDTDEYLRFINFQHPIEYKKAGYLDEIDKFDYEFWRISRKEACLMDPNQRLFIETAWEAIEDAGYAGNRIRGSNTGVFLGFIADLGYKQYIDAVEPDSSIISIPGNNAGITASRISYILNLEGPALVVDTTCSSSLVAVHLACRSIISGDCDMALAGGIKLLLLPVAGGEKFEIESSSSRTKAFDAGADGTAFGEGAGVVLLKSLDAALRDHDHIYAVIRGSAVNQDGSSAGLTAPNADAQASVIRKAWKSASIDPAAVAFIEAHGTGTRLGDPIEIDGINKAFRHLVSKKGFCAIGAGKTNIGHLDSASGIAGFIKAVLSLQHKTVPKLLHFNEPNPKINFKDSPVYIAGELIHLENSSPLNCGVSAFGLSGTNCHIILEEAAAPKTDRRNCTSCIFTLSARNKEVLDKIVEQYIVFLNKYNEEDISDIGYTVNTGREHFDFRLAVITQSKNDLVEKLQLFLTSNMESSGQFYYGAHKKVTQKRGDNQITEMLPADISFVEAEVNNLLMNLSFKNNNDIPILQKLCVCYAKGAGINWELYYKHDVFKKVSLPLYCFEKKRCWLETGIKKNSSREMDFNETINYLDVYYQAMKNKFHGPAMYPEEIKEYALILLIKSFKDMGFICEQNRKINCKFLLQQARIIDKYKRFLIALIEILKQSGYVDFTGEEIIIHDKVFNSGTIAKIQDLTISKNTLIKKYNSFRYYIEILETSISHYPVILTGKVNGSNILFPDSSTEVIENIYKDDEKNDSCNMLASGCVRLIANFILKNKKTLRIIEAGAGIGGTTAWILKELSPFVDNIEYYYTDISPALLMYGRKNFGTKFPSVRFKKLDLEKNIKDQGFTSHSFDIFIAANVIHATKNIKNTLDQIKRLVHGNGYIVLIEGVKVIDFSTLAFGVLDGWWLFDDEELRLSNAPMLSEDSWKKVLNENGFKRVWCAGEIDWNQRLFISAVSSNAVPVNEEKITIAQNNEQSRNNKDNPNVSIHGRGDNAYSENELVLADIWSSVLALPAVNIYDDFYSLGGDSIIATKILNAINTRYSIEIQFSDLMNYPTIEELSRYLEKDHVDKNKISNLYSSIKPALVIPFDNESFIVPVSSAQRRMYAVSRLDDSSTTYNIPGKVMIKGRLDIERLEESFQKLIQRHENLRTGFEYVDGKLMQRIHEHILFNIEYKDACETGTDTFLADFVKPFDLSKPPLLRLLLATVNKDEYILYIDIHHIIADGVSINILIREFAEIYNGRKLAPLTIQYKDYTAWQQELFDSGLLKNEEEFWLKKLSGNIPLLDLPIDYPWPAYQSFEGDSIVIRVNDMLLESLNKLAAELGVTLFMILLAVYNILLSKYCGQEDILVGSVIAGRRNKNIENMIGMFVNILVMRHNPSPVKSFVEFVKEVKINCIEVYENQDFQFEMLIEKIGIHRDLSRNPLFDTVFSMQNIDDVKELVIDDIKFSSTIVKTKTVRFPLSINTLEKKDGTYFEWQYSTQLFKKQTVQRLLDDFVKILTIVTNNNRIQIKDIKLQKDFKLLAGAPDEDILFNL